MLNDQHHALHAGAVCNGKNCIILPGSSGKGKSTLTAWLITNGYQYLTDELVLLSNDGHVSPLTRPINLKGSNKLEILPVPQQDGGESVSGSNGSMVPLRLLNPEFSHLQPYVTHVIFPEFRESGTLQLEKISAAKSSLSHAIACERQKPQQSRYAGYFKDSQAMSVI